MLELISLKLLAGTVSPVWYKYGTRNQRRVTNTKALLKKVVIFLYGNAFLWALGNLKTC